MIASYSMLIEPDSTVEEYLSELLSCYCLRIYSSVQCSRYFLYYCHFSTCTCGRVDFLVFICSVVNVTIVTSCRISSELLTDLIQSIEIHHDMSGVATYKF